MTRYILIDRNSGTVWADSAHLNNASFNDSPIEFARAVDREFTGINPDEFEYWETHSRDTNACYFLYRAPNGFREITDGSSGTEIQAVEDECDRLGAIGRRSKTGDEE